MPSCGSSADQMKTTMTAPTHNLEENTNAGRAYALGLNLLGISIPNGIGVDEARYNLATRIMSNGVEVIVAGDKSTLPGEPNVLRTMPSSLYKPTTLNPSTLHEDHHLTITSIDPQVRAAFFWALNTLTALLNCSFGNQREEG